MLWFVSLPYALLYKSIPDCRQERFEKLYMGTFVMSIVWIGLLSYAMLYFTSRSPSSTSTPSLPLPRTHP